MKICSEEGCTRPFLARGLCKYHYEEWKKSDTFYYNVPACKEECSFPECGRPQRSNGFCHAHVNQLNKGKDLSPLKLPKPKVKCQFDNCVNIEYCKGYCRSHYMQLWEGKPVRALEGICDICKGWAPLVSDHDHDCCQTNRNRCGKCERGFLCQTCNLTLGRVNDDIGILENMIEYLEKHKENYNV